MAESQDINDIIVLGLGAMGSSSFYHAAKAGKRVLGIEQFGLAHNKGSSHGETRIIREAYHEGEFYVKMAQTAAKLWRKLEEESGVKLYERVGCLMVGEANSKILSHSKQSADYHSLPYKMYDPSTIASRVTEFKLPAGYLGLFDESAGFVYSERCIEQHILVGQRLNKNAKALFNTKVSTYFTRSDGIIEVKTEAGQTYLTKQLVISAGLWNASLLKDVKIPLVIQKNTVAWFDVQDETHRLGKLPCYLIENKQGVEMYGFPNALGTGVKAGVHLDGKTYTDPSQIDYNLDQGAIEKIRTAFTPFLPKVAVAPIVKYAVCFYTRTPDDHFVIDYHPNNQNIVLLSPCSGHGFKFSSTIGQMALDLLMKKTTPLKEFKIERFNAKPRL